MTSLPANGVYWLMVYRLSLLVKAQVYRLSISSKSITLGLLANDQSTGCPSCPWVYWLIVYRLMTSLLANSLPVNDLLADSLPAND